MPAPIILICALWGIWRMVPAMIADNIRNDAVLSAKETANQFKTLRGYYTKHVVGKALKARLLKPTINHKADPGGIPLPATLIHDMSALLENRDISVKLYSPFPFPGRAARELDSFQREAWSRVRSNPENSFVREEIDDAGRVILRVGIADRMVAQACVDCHNSRIDSPKSDWKLGDVRGVLEIATVIDPRLLAGAVVSENIVIGGALVTFVLLFIMVALMIRVVVRPLSALGDSMMALAGGDKSINVPLTGRQDEIGDMARTVAVFKNNLIENDRLQLEQGHAQEQLLRAHKMEVVGQLTRGVAHDFNNLLAATMSNAHLLEQRAKGREDLRALAQSIITVSQKGADITHRLLAFSNNQVLQPELVNLGALFEGMAGLLRSSLGKTVHINLQVKPDIWRVMADPGQVENVLLNLTLNASNAMPGGGELTIQVENAQVTDGEWAERWEGLVGEYVMLRVTDAGAGMPPHVLERAFEPYFTTKVNSEGSGMGLSMVYGFAQQSGGFTTIESASGVGTTVTVYLPKARGRDPSVVGQSLLRPQKGQGEVILLIEDEANIRAATSGLLEILDYRVLTAEDGASALEVEASADRIDLVLSNLILPGNMDGYEVWSQLRSRRPGLKCLFMSSVALSPDQQLPNGGDLLIMPIQMAELAARVREVLNS